MAATRWPAAQQVRQDLADRAVAVNDHVVVLLVLVECLLHETHLDVKWLLRTSDEPVKRSV
jgi:hypothetical protein